ncbi:MAG: hypothetical protein ACRDHY_11120, partial [Anaerolineales bacterium]
MESSPAGVDSAADSASGLEAESGAERMGGRGSPRSGRRSSRDGTKTGRRGREGIVGRVGAPSSKGSRKLLDGEAPAGIGKRPTRIDKKNEIPRSHDRHTSPGH